MAPKSGSEEVTSVEDDDKTLNSVTVNEDDDPSFSSSIGIIFSLLGCVVGTGNIWRFPRIAAQNSQATGSFTFLVVWSIFLFLWSSPMILIEYAVGRYCKSSPIRCFVKFLGPKALWCGGWIIMVAFFISAYYSVVVGWCFYYVFYSISTPDLPANEEISLQVFNDYTGSWLPVLTHFLAIIVGGACVIGGISWIEKANLVLVPALLVIIIFTFLWSLTRPYADFGITFLFTPSWGSITNPRLWVDAAAQNAFDTGAAMGLFVPYASYFTRKTGVVRLGYLIPAGNNMVSIICGLTIFSTVFSTLIYTEPTLTRTGILEIIQQSGPGSTGLTFIWIPILFAKVGILGRVLCVLFFFCLSFAGISSLIANIQLTSQGLTDFGLHQRLAGPIAMLITFLIGLGSAMSLNFLTNQDFVWGFALMISGLMFQFMVIIYGVFKFQREIVNNYGLKDWKLRINWVIIVQVIAPLEALGLLAWWAFSLIANGNAEKGSRWFDIGKDTFLTTILEWFGLLLFLVVVNVVLFFKRPSWMIREHVEDQLTVQVTQSSVNLAASDMDLDKTSAMGANENRGFEGITHL